MIAKIVELEALIKRCGIVVCVGGAEEILATSMVFERFHASPAERQFTLWTVHVIAASVFLNRCFACVKSQTLNKISENCIKNSHCGHGLVFLAIQFFVAGSSVLSSVDHCVTISHGTVSWLTSPHSKQNQNPHLHFTNAFVVNWTLTALTHRGAGQKRISRLLITKLFDIKVWYFFFKARFGRSFKIILSSSSKSQSWPAQLIDSAWPSSWILVVKYSIQQAEQNWCPQSNFIKSSSSKQISQAALSSVIACRFRFDGFGTLAALKSAFWSS